MKILLLCTDAYGGYGGIALYNRDLAEALASHPSVEEVIVVPRLVRAPVEQLPENVNFVREAADGLSSYARVIARLAMRRSEYALVVCAHVNLLPIARMMTDRIRLLVYGLEAWKPTRLLTLPLLERVASVLSISEVTLRRLKEWSGWEGTSYLLPNAIRLEQYGIRPRDGLLARRLGVENRRIVLTLGRIAAAERYKGFDEVLEVMPELVRDVPDIVYVIAGGGADTPRLEAKAATLGVREHVVFTGVVDEREKAALYGLADVYAMPSRGEGFGFVLLEALASGVPVIASRFDGGFEAIRQGTLGRAVDPANPAEIRTAIMELLAAPERAIPDGVSYFAFENFVSRVHSTLDDLMRGAE